MCMYSVIHVTSDTKIPRLTEQSHKNYPLLAEVSMTGPPGSKLMF